jgi:hypothetical protein
MSEAPPTLPTKEADLLGSVGRDKLPRRKSTLENGQRIINGEMYTIPDPVVMAAIEQETAGKVTYFPAREPAPDAFGGDKTGTPLYYEAIFEPLCAELLRRFPDKNIALRAVMTSINGTLDGAMGEGADILDIAETVSRGTEKDHDVFNVQVMANRSAGPGVVDEASVSDAVTSLKYIAKYTERVGFALSYETDPTPETPDDFEDAVFPAVLVYDASGLRNTEHDRFTATFRDGVVPQEVLLGAYVLDRP